MKRYLKKKLKKISEISPALAYRKTQTGTLLVDVREEDEVDQMAFDVPNILNIPLSVFEKLYIKLPKNQELILVCHGGVRSMRAAWFLLEHGFTKMKNMKYGITGWVKNGYPVKTPVSQVINNCLCCNFEKNNSGSCCNSNS